MCLSIRNSRENKSLIIQMERSNSHIALYGRDDTPYLVALQKDEEEGKVRLYFKRNGHIEVEKAPWYPFFFLKDQQLLSGFPHHLYRIRLLRGENAYRYVVAFFSSHAYQEALAHILQQTDDPKAVYREGHALRQYLVQSGRTLFKGMSLNDLHRMQLDIEVFASDGFPQAEREEDRILLIALSDNRGWEHVIDGRYKNEAEMLTELVSLIRTRDPDVIEGHNIFRFDWPYLMARAARVGVELRVGRDGSSPHTFSSSVRFAERVLDFTALEIAGRHVIDTYFQVMAYDVFKRDLPSYGLKAVARYFGFATSERTYIDGEDIASTWLSNPDRLVRYALDDVRETRRLAEHLSGSAFYLTQMIPMLYEEVARTGPAAKIEALFVREYLRRRYALPAGERGTQTAGGYTDVFATGVLGPIVYADVESLYPSIMLHYHIKPRSDVLNLFSDLLEQLTRLRLETKRQMKEAQDEHMKSELDARQASYKILINSFYGMLGFSRALFNDAQAADQVALTGQRILRSLITAILQAGGQVIEVDTDGVLFVPPADVQGEEAEKSFIARLNQRMPSGIRIGFEGRYRRMLSYKKKNYALLRYDGKILMKGSSLVARSVEPFGRRFVEEAIRYLLHEDIAGLHQLYLQYRRRIIQHDWQVDDFARTETLRERLEHYLQAVQSGKRARSAAYELALDMRRGGRVVRKGDRIRYYVTGTHPNVQAFAHARLASAWDPSAPDENTAYYLRRLDEFAAKFKVFFTPQDFKRIFSPEDLFGFSAPSIQIRTEIQQPRFPEEVPF